MSVSAGNFTGFVLVISDLSPSQFWTKIHHWNRVSSKQWKLLEAACSHKPQLMFSSSPRRAWGRPSLLVQSHPSTPAATGERRVLSQPTSSTRDGAPISKCFNPPAKCPAHNGWLAPRRANEQRAHAHVQPGETSASEGTCWEHRPLPLT